MRCTPGRARRWILTATVPALVLASCAAGAPEGAAPDGSSPQAAPPATTPAPSSPSPQPTDDPTEHPPEAPRELRFTAPALGGGTIEGADYAGRDLVIWFWAPW